jgi:hypothetical protein
MEWSGCGRVLRDGYCERDSETLLAHAFMLVYSSTLKTEAPCSSETSVLWTDYMLFYYRTVAFSLGYAYPSGNAKTCRVCKIEKKIYILFSDRHWIIRDRFRIAWCYLKHCFGCRLWTLYKLNYAPTTLGVQSWNTRTKNVEYHRSKSQDSFIMTAVRTLAMNL